MNALMHDKARTVKAAIGADAAAGQRAAGHDAGGRAGRPPLCVRWVARADVAEGPLGPERPA